MEENKPSDEGANEDLETGSEDIDIAQPFCEPCGIEGSHVLADGFCKTCTEFLCGKCYKYHCKPKPMRHHVLIDAQNMPKTKAIVEENDDSGEKCLKHEQMPLKIYCKSHNDFGCVLCLSDEHKACKDVSFIQDCAKGVADSKEYRVFKSELATLQASFKTEIGLAEANVKSINDICAKLKISEAVSLLTLMLKDVEDLGKKKDEMKTNGLQLMNSATEVCEQSLIQLSKLLDDHIPETVQFMNMKRGQTMITQTKRCLEKAKSDNQSVSGNIHLEDAQKCLCLLTNVKTCLELQADSSDAITKKSQSHVPKGIDVISMFSLAISGETMDCRITGSAVLSDGQLALVDYCNENITIISPSEGHTIRKFKLEGKPFDVVEVRSGKIAVTRPSRKKISILILEEEELNTDSNINTTGPCYGIAYADNLFYVTIEKRPKIEIINMKGAVLKTFALDGKNQALFASPWYVAIDPARERVYVTDRDKDTLTCLTKTGEVVHVYQSSDMKRPYGIAVGESGMIFICARRTNKLVCLNKEFKPVKIIQDETRLHKAESVAAWGKQDRLYIGAYRKDNVTVLDLQKY